MFKSSMRAFHSRSQQLRTYFDVPGVQVKQSNFANINKIVSICSNILMRKHLQIEYGSNIWEIIID